MRKKWIFMMLLCFISLQSEGAGFCDGVNFVPFDKILKSPDEYLNNRVMTQVILTTDAKEFERLWFAEKSKFTLLTALDDESIDYYKKHHLSEKHQTNVVSDLFEKLKDLEGGVYKKDMTKIKYYRQEVMECGRLVWDQNELRFAVDDENVERSYLVPW